MAKRSLSKMEDSVGDMMNDDSPLRLRLHEPTIEVVVGTEKKRFFLHKTALCKPGTFFESALKKEWTEKNVLELPNDDPVLFELYGEWLYSNKIFCKNLTGVERYEILSKLYVLGGKYLDRSFQNCVADNILASFSAKNENGHHEVPCVACVNLIYSGTPPGSPIRRLMVEIYAFVPSTAWSESHQKDLICEFLIDLIVQFEKDLTESGVKHRPTLK